MAVAVGSGAGDQRVGGGFRSMRAWPGVAMRVGRLQAHYRSEGTRQKAISTRRLRARPSGVSFSVA